MKDHKKNLWLVALLAFVMTAGSALAQVKDHRDIKYPKLPEFKVPSPETYKLKNGMTVFLIEDHELPLIRVTARVRSGSNYEPAEKTGLGDIFGQAHREGGTSSMTGDEIDDFLEARAAFIETGMGGDVGTASMNCLTDDFSEVFSLFKDVLLDPVFDEAKIELAKRQVKTGIARRNDNVGSIVGREFNRLMYGADSALGRNTEYATVAAVTRDDLIAWHKKYYHPNNVYLGVSGDFDSAKMKETIEKTFGEWPEGPAFDEAEVAYRKPSPGVHFIEKTDVTQANIRLGHLGIETGNPDYFAVQVMNEVLGGSFASRLFSNVRSEKGLAYNVFGGIGSSFTRPGVFRVGLSTKSSTMGEAVDALKEEVDGIINNPPNDDEMQRATESILNSFVFNYTSVGQILGQQMTYAYYGMPADFLEKYRSNIEKVTGADVARVAKKYIHPDQMALLVVGKAEDFDRPVASFGEVNEIDISIPPPPDTAPKLTRTPQSLEAGAKLFARTAGVIAGSGAKIKSIKSDATLVVKMGGQSMSLGQSVVTELPDKLTTTMRTPMGEQKIVINGDRGMVFAGGQQQPLPDSAVADRLSDLNRQLLFLVNGLGDEGLEAVAAGSEDVDGAPCEIVAVTFGGSESRLWVAADGTVAKQVYQGKHPMRGTPGTIEVRFSDYREQDGRMIPYKQTMLFEGEELGSMEVDTIAINPELEAGTFEIPTGG